MQKPEKTLKNQCRYFIYLSKGHFSKTWKANYSCVKCKSTQHMSICSAKDDKKKINADNNTPSHTERLLM